MPFHSPLFDQRDSISGEDADITGPRNPQWARWLDMLNGLGDATGKKVSIGGAPGLPTDNHMATLPVSLQGLQGAEYGYDEFGAPTSVRTKRGR